jgi:predicted RNA-binding protein with PUA domain
MDTPISQSSISLNLSLIQKRCEELLEEEGTELSLEDPAHERPADDSCNPYSRG